MSLPERDAIVAAIVKGRRADLRRWTPEGVADILVEAGLAVGNDEGATVGDLIGQICDALPAVENAFRCGRNIRDETL